MSKNPCRNCKHSFFFNGQHTHCWEYVFDCEEYKKHREYLDRKRKFTKGDRITTIEELLKQEWVIWVDSTRHIEVIKNLQLSTIIRFLKSGYFYKAIRKEVDNE